MEGFPNISVAPVVKAIEQFVRDKKPDSVDECEFRDNLFMVVLDHYALQGGNLKELSRSSARVEEATSVRAAARLLVRTLRAVMINPNSDLPRYTEDSIHTLARDVRKKLKELPGGPLPYQTNRILQELVVILGGTRRR